MPNDSRQKCLVILGMHRSGTSALAGVLHLLGVNLGKEFLHTLGDNPKGVFENNKVYRCNEALLESLHSSWNDQFPLPEHWWQQENLSVHKHNAIEILQSEFTTSEFFAIKDPRMCVLLPFWQSIFQERHITPYHLIIIRNPLEIASSLAKRDHFSLEKSVILWMNSLLQAELHSRNHPRAFISFDDLLKNTSETITFISSALSLKFPENYQDIEPRINEFLTPDLKHHNIEDKAINKRLLSFMSKYYAILQSFVNNPAILKKELRKIDRLRSGYYHEATWFYNKDIQKTFKGNEEEIQRLRPHYYAQLYVDTGTGFYEEQSIVQQITGIETQLEFELSDYDNITGLRFDPVNSRTVLTLDQIKILTANNILHSEVSYQTNGLYQKNNLLIFETHDPIIEIDTIDIIKPKTVVIRLNYRSWGPETYKYISEEKSSIIKVKDEQLYQQTEALQGKDAELHRQAEALQGKDAELHRQAEALQGKDAELHRQAEALQGKDAELHRQAEALQGKDTELHRQAEALQGKDAELHRQAEALQGKDTELHRQAEALQVKDAELQQKIQHIQEMEKTFTWKVAMLLGAIIHCDFLTDSQYYTQDTLTGKMLRLGARTLWPKRLIRKSGLFDKDYYLENNPEIAEAGVESLRHFIKQGGFEGRKPHSEFDSAYYLARNPGVKHIGMNPLIHYILYGEREGRQPNPDFDPQYYFARYSDVKAAGVPPLRHYIMYGKKEGRHTFYVSDPYQDPYQLWIKKNEPSQEELTKQKRTTFDYAPKISIVSPTYNTPKQFLINMIESVINQTYSHWELCVADGGSQELHVQEILQRYTETDARIKVTFLPENRGIAGNSNEALALATGDFIVLLDHDDTLAPFALFEVVKKINELPEADYIYSDEDKLSENGKMRSEPHFKPDWSPDFFRSYNYTMHLSVYSKELLKRIGGFREGFEGSQDYDLNLRATEKAQKIVHIPKILYHWRIHENSVAGSEVSKPYAYDSGKKALEDHLKRTGIQGRVENGLTLGIYKITYEIQGSPKISIIIPNQDHTEDLQRCVETIINKSSYKNFEIIIMENGSVEEETFTLYEKLKKLDWIKVTTWDKPFNFAAINNAGVRYAEGDVLLFLNNDTEVINSDWLERMLEHALRKDIGGVGAKLYYPDDTIQHAGVIIGIASSAGHSHKHAPRQSPGYFRRLEVIQNVSAVTAACLMIRKEVFLEVDGFDERYTLAFNDVDLCLKIREKGYLVVWTPYAELYHDESKTRGYEDTPEKRERYMQELQILHQDWRSIFENGDLYYNPNLTLDREDFSINISNNRDEFDEWNFREESEGENTADFRVKLFLETDDSMSFSEFEKPLLTVILILFNRSELTFQCLESIKAHADISYQIIIVDNASSDNTSHLLERLRNIKIIKNTENIGFLKACNQAVEYATGKYVLFLNNDTQVLPNTFSALVNTIESDPKIGVVGGKLIFPNGKLQEAGGIIWQDGTCVSYGRNDVPNKPQYSYVKEVYYCSGALLLTRHELFVELGAFDESYTPAYYEEVDYCMKVRENGYKVVYQPFAQVIHHEFASSQNSEQAIRLQERNRTMFTKKWAKRLKTYHKAGSHPLLLARETPYPVSRKRVLFIDDRIPDSALGRGYPRSFDILEALIALRYQITFFPTMYSKKPRSVTQHFQQQGIEVMYDATGEGYRLSYEDFLARRANYYDVIFISRPHNMEAVLPSIRQYAPSAHLIYDCEAMFAEREILLMGIRREKVIPAYKEQLIKHEISLAQQADSVTTVSPKEKRTFEQYGIRNIHVVGFALEERPTPASFEERQDLLFVGSIPSENNPNEDAVLYFAEHIFPQIHDTTGAKLYIVGTNESKDVWKLDSENIRVVGRVDDLTEYYNRCKIFVVPTRYAAGLPYKLYNAAAHGIPAVVTPLIAEQVGWQEGNGFLIGDTKESFAKKCIELYQDKALWEIIKDGASTLMKRDCSPNIFRKNLRKALIPNSGRD